MDSKEKLESLQYLEAQLAKYEKKVQTIKNTIGLIKSVPIYGESPLAPAIRAMEAYMPSMPIFGAPKEPKVEKIKTEIQAALFDEKPSIRKHYTMK